jgi:threonine/homoserine/homoserine lactone efflux protein
MQLNMPSNFILLYTTTIFIATIIPGPGMLLALTHGMLYGAKRTTASALGNLVVTLLQASVSIAGLGAVLIASETLFGLIKYIGAAYLVYMGISILCRSENIFLSDNGCQAAAGMSLTKLFMQSALVTAGNPKAIIFFTAVFPQFIDPHAAYLPQFCLLMGIGATIAFGCFMLYAVCGQKIIALLSATKIMRWFNRTIGSAFVLSGIGLATSNR